MPTSKLTPAIEGRLGALLEVTRRQQHEHSQGQAVRPTITISREFGCEAYPATELLRLQLEQHTKEPWALMDKALLDEVAKNHNLSQQVFNNLGEKNRFLDDFISTFSSSWKSDKDYFRLLSRQIISLAEQGNVILVGRGAPFVTSKLKNCFSFRLYASHGFKEASIVNRLGISADEARDLIKRRQKERDAFIRDFLDHDPYDLSIYNLVFNNDRNSVAKTAQTMFEYVTSQQLTTGQP